MGERSHLFISYAGEDGDFADWLALRLASEGYRVWFDRIHLLGGESYPKDIDVAIKERTFRLLALLSRSSLRKPNPVKERTIALNIARERKVNFLIPLNVDGLSATELDWMTSDLTFIPFNVSWADGFARLLKNLNSIGAPKDPAAGKKRVCSWFAARDGAADKTERLWTNVFPILDMPEVLHKFEFQERLILPKLGEKWAFFSPTNSNIAWSFAAPDASLDVPLKEIWSGPWREVSTYDGLVLEDVALSILRKAVSVRCIEMGMKVSPKPTNLYFPQGLLSEDRLQFTNYSGGRTSVKVVGERTFVSGEKRERNRYHLAPVFRADLNGFSQPVLRLNMRVYFTDLAGNPLDSKKVVSRRKALCRNWWNHEWLSRVIAVIQWLSADYPAFTVLTTEKGNFRIASEPIFLQARSGIDETKLVPIREEDESAPVDEDLGDLDTESDEDGGDREDDD
jgi:hypothetical protein